MPLKVITRLDCLTGKKKKEYMRGGFINMYSLYDNIEKIPSYNEIQNMDIEAGSKLLESLRGKFKIKELMEHWKVSDYTIYHSLYPKFGVKTNYNRKSKKGIDRNMDSKGYTSNTNTRQIDNINYDEIKKHSDNMSQAAVVVKAGMEEIMNKIKSSETEGFNIRLKGIFDGKPLQTRLLKIGDMLEDSIEYEILLTINEIKKGAKD